MKRHILAELEAWKVKKERKPLLLTGARQVGKTFALQAFGAAGYEKTDYLNFEEMPGLAAIFELDLQPERILREIGFHLNRTINPERDFLIFDEIQEIPKAITSCKYFVENLPGLSLAGAGSLLGLHLAESNFPVGKVEFLDMHPMSFSEFLLGIGDDKSYRFLEEFDFKDHLPEVVHRHLWEMLKTYFIVGGLPEAVSTYAKLQKDTLKAYEEVRKKQRDLTIAYLADVAKHAGKVNSMHIERVWSNVPAQLARTLDGSAPKFRFKGVVPGIQGYARLAGAIDWLKAAGLIFKIPIVNKAWHPLTAYAEERAFKLYLFDVGLLGSLAGLSPKVLRDFSFGSYKGYIAENFALQEMIVSGSGNPVAWRENTAEVEFLLERDGIVLPIEIKSGWATKSKSLRVFAGKYQPPRRVTLSAKNLSIDKSSGIFQVPLYLAGYLSRLPAVA